MSGLCYGSNKINPSECFQIYSLYGYASTLAAANKYVDNDVLKDYFLKLKQQENKDLVDKVKRRAFTITAKDSFNQYSTQTFLDNALRGGVSTKIYDDVILYLFGRKHGDLERDYNDFFLQDTYFSQGNGAFRDVAQNRRCELFFNPCVGNKNIIYFFNLIQSDGYNPLVLKNTKFLLQNSKILLDDERGCSLQAKFNKFFSCEFKFVELWDFLKSNLEEDDLFEETIRKVLKYADEIEDADFNSGYWSDHWTYLIDLIENFYAIFPDKISFLLFEDNSFVFYDTEYFVMPRSKKYILTDLCVRQYNSVVLDRGKADLIESREGKKNQVRVNHGKGKVYYTNLLVKILSIVLNKLASLDPFCIGMEMEAGRPGWCDALNGLPSILGSSINETIELKRLIDFMLMLLQKLVCDNCDFLIPKEIYQLLQVMRDLLEKNKVNEDNYFVFWDKSHLAKEEFRKDVFFGFDGKEIKVNFEYIIDFFNKSSIFLGDSIDRSKDHFSGGINTYFINEPIDYDHVVENNKTTNCVRIKRFKQTPLPLFMEGFVHAFRLTKSIDEAKHLHHIVNSTKLYDKKLKMYRMNLPLGNNLDLGRIGIFNYGWLENGSIFLHMHYKYVLEMVKNGLIDQFYSEIKTLLVPFHNPTVYRRSITENVSFIVSSGYDVDVNDHGRGYVSRLSGSTAEFIHIWCLLMFGEKPFYLNDRNKLTFQLLPQLHKDLFLKDAVTIFPFLNTEEKVNLCRNTLAFNFLGNTLVVYHNDLLKNTYGDERSRIKKYCLEYFNGREVCIEGETINGADAVSIRSGEVKIIDAYLE